MAICKTARFRVRPEGRERCEAAIREFLAGIRVHETGTRLYLSLRSREEPAEYLHVMIFEDEEAERFHRGTDWVRRFVEVLYPETEDGVRFTDFDLLDTT